MPKDCTIKTVLLLGAGPIVIGQACEFDYSGTQAVLALKEEGCRVVLINSNPATIMTDPDLADATYIEPITPQFVAEIIAKERPDAILPTMGGQTALNCAMALFEQGVLAQYQVRLLGVTPETIDKAENREKFKQFVEELGLAVPESQTIYKSEQAQSLSQALGFPLIVRTSYTLAGSGSGIAHTPADLNRICVQALAHEATQGILLERSITGWKEYELEVMSDKAGNCIIICSIENLDPMGVHTGDSITVAPAQTLTDKEYQAMRNATFKLMRSIGMKTGGCNVQFAINPHDGRMLVIEMNPRVSRSSALASKATGFPIAKVATKLALGYTLDELANELTHGVIPASFEPVLDYVVVKIPRFNFDKFPGADTQLTTQMKSVGEVMAIGRSFQEAVQKALRSLETGVIGFETKFSTTGPIQKQNVMKQLKIPNAERLLWIATAFHIGLTLETVHRLTQIDPWFLCQLQDLVQSEKSLSHLQLANLDRAILLKLKVQGFADAQLARQLNTTEAKVRAYRQQLNIRPVFKRIDSCAGEFPTHTAYLYSTYDAVCEALPSLKDKVLIIGSGPNRIGQGIEFDYCCVHAVLALKQQGYETIMINSNPETVSTDYNIADRLYFEPLNLENILAIIEVEEPKGVIVQLGGQTPLRLAADLEMAGVNLLGISTQAIDKTENRRLFKNLLSEIGLAQPLNETFTTQRQALKLADQLGYPLIVRPSYILGGNAITIIQNKQVLLNYLKRHPPNGYPVLIEQFLSGAVEVEIDAVTDGNEVFIGGVMQQFEPAGIHSGDSSCSLPAFNLPRAQQTECIRQVHLLAKALSIRGFINVQFAISQDKIYVLEVNPRASRTIPFIAKATGLPLVKMAIHCIMGFRLKEFANLSASASGLHAVKIPVFPFHKFQGADKRRGPEMKSTGEVMGLGATLDEAIAKAKLAAGKYNENITSFENYPCLVNTPLKTYSLQEYVPRQVIGS